MTREAGPGRPQNRRLASALLTLDRKRYTVEHHAKLSAAELRLLWILSDGQARTLREIGDTLHLEQSTVNRQVNGAIEAGYLYRYAELDRASRLIAPTAEGQQRFHADTEFILRAYDEALAALGADSDQFLVLLEKFVAAYSDTAAHIAESAHTHPQD